MKTLQIGNAATLSAPKVNLARILFTTDFSSYSKAALPYAIAIARQHGAKLYGAHVVSTDAYTFATPETWPALVEYQEAQAHIACARLEESLRGTPHQVASAVGDIADVIFRLVYENDIDLIVLGTHWRTGLCLDSSSGRRRKNSSGKLRARFLSSGLTYTMIRNVLWNSIESFRPRISARNHCLRRHAPCLSPRSRILTFTCCM